MSPAILSGVSLRWLYFIGGNISSDLYFVERVVKVRINEAFTVLLIFQTTSNWSKILQSSPTGSAGVTQEGSTSCKCIVVKYHCMFKVCHLAMKWVDLQNISLLDFINSKAMFVEQMSYVILKKMKCFVCLFIQCSHQVHYINNDNQHH